MSEKSREEYLTEMLKYPPDEALRLFSYDIRNVVGLALGEASLLSENPQTHNSTSSSIELTSNEILEMITQKLQSVLQVTTVIDEYVDKYQKKHGTIDKPANG